MRDRRRADVDGVGGHARRRVGQRAIGCDAESPGDGSSEVGSLVDDGGDPSAVLLPPPRNVFGLSDVATTDQYHVERHAVCSLVVVQPSFTAAAIAPMCGARSWRLTRICWMAACAVLIAASTPRLPEASPTIKTGDWCMRVASPRRRLRSILKNSLRSRGRAARYRAPGRCSRWRVPGTR